ELLLAEQFKVLLRLVQPREESQQMKTAAAQARWRQFLISTLDRFGDQLEAVEIGNTINRRRWSGYLTIDHFMAAWSIAHEQLRIRGIQIAGPNISDFEHPYNAGVLSVMARNSCLPDIHTNNLFAERAVEPENYDHKIIGRRLVGLHKLNLVKKACLLGRISKSHNIGKTWSTSAFWSLKRIARRLENSEEKQADYLVRYLVLSAASGGLERAYWGPLVSHREGLVDDGTGFPAKNELVSFYGSTLGKLKDYRIRPAFHAYAFFNQMIPGSRYNGKLTAKRFQQVHEFETPDHRIHVLWTTNTRILSLQSLYSEEVLRQAECISRDGQHLQDTPSAATERPLYLRWPITADVTVDRNATVSNDVLIDGSRRDGQYFHFSDGRWKGLVFATDREQADLIIANIHPEKIAAPTAANILRKSRNLIWTIPDPRHPDRLLAVKKPNRLRFNKKIYDYFKPSKAVRSWNGAFQLLRHGLNSPLPVAFIERAEGKDTLNNWYVCEYAGKVPSVREFFAAFATGEDSYLGVSKTDFMRSLSKFLLKLHARGAYFRDLTGGNILVELGAGQAVKFSLIDTARARFYQVATPLNQRLADLSRSCYKLDWQSRIQFMELYLAGLNKKFSLLYRLPFHGFDLKMKVKRSWKRKPSRQITFGVLLPFLCTRLSGSSAKHINADRQQLSTEFMQTAFLKCHNLSGIIHEISPLLLV
ncbi:MAG: lipopolysaccharide kinase InaA family protein, partial [Pseudohongiellaceae bacterium]